MSINTQTLREFLEENQNKKISSVMGEILSLAATTKASTTSYRDPETDEVVAIYCYYHKQWELVSEVEYGSKSSHHTGLNTMCKIGNKLWNVTNKKKKELGSVVLDMLEQGDIQPDEIAVTKERLEAELDGINTTDMPIGYPDLNSALAHYEEIKNS